MLGLLVQTTQHPPAACVRFSLMSIVHCVFQSLLRRAKNKFASLRCISGCCAWFGNLAFECWRLNSHVLKSFVRDAKQNRWQQCSRLCLWRNTCESLRYWRLKSLVSRSLKPVKIYFPLFMTFWSYSCKQFWTTSRVMVTTSLVTHGHAEWLIQ